MLVKVSISVLLSSQLKKLSSFPYVLFFKCGKGRSWTRVEPALANKLDVRLKLPCKNKFYTSSPADILQRGFYPLKQQQNINFKS